MAEYKQSNLAGSTYTRSYRMVIENPYQGTPFIRIIEEEVLNFEDKDPIKLDKGEQICKEFDPNASFPLRNPLTDELLGAHSNQQQLQLLLYSMVRDMQEQRDFNA